MACPAQAQPRCQAALRRSQQLAQLRHHAADQRMMMMMTWGLWVGGDLATLSSGTVLQVWHQILVGLHTQ